MRENPAGVAGPKQQLLNPTVWVARFLRRVDRLLIRDATTKGRKEGKESRASPRRVGQLSPLAQSFCSPNPRNCRGLLALLGTGSLSLTSPRRSVGWLAFSLQLAFYGNPSSNRQLTPYFKIEIVCFPGYTRIVYCLSYFIVWNRQDQRP